MGKSLTDQQISGNILKFFNHAQFLNNTRTPISAQLILTNVCNLKCSFCCNKHRDQTISLKSNTIIDILKTLADLGCKGVEFTGGSEPTTHPALNGALDYCASLGMKPALVTNGVRLKYIPKEILAKLDWIRISINGSRNTYETIHGFNYYDSVMEGLEVLKDINIPNKGVSFIFCNKTPLNDAQLLLNDLQDKKLNYFRFSVDVFEQPGALNFKPEFYSPKLPVIYHSDRDIRIPKKCRIFYYKPVIDCSGYIYPCCTNMHKELYPLCKIEDLNKLKDMNIELDTSKCYYCIYGDINDIIVNKEEIPIKNINFI